MSRRAKLNEILVEAGCWNGGSTAKFSLVAELYGYNVHVFDSFEGVREWDFAYAAKLTDVQKNVRKFGELNVCSFHPGWFRETLWQRPITFPVRMAYIDCDVPLGTIEALSGILPALVEDGSIYTQDYHLLDVKKVIDDPKTWSDFRTKLPSIKPLIRNIARIRWDSAK